MPQRYPALASAGQAEPGPLGRGEPLGEPQRHAQDRQADQRDHHQAETEPEAEGEDEDDREPDDQAGQVASHGEPGARRNQIADEEHGSDAMA
jgi:hypothetical protein